MKKSYKPTPLFLVYLYVLSHRCLWKGVWCWAAHKEVQNMRRKFCSLLRSLLHFQAFFSNWKYGRGRPSIYWISLTSSWNFTQTLCASHFEDDLSLAFSLNIYWLKTMQKRFFCSAYTLYASTSKKDCRFKKRGMWNGYGSHIHQRISPFCKYEYVT